MAVKQVTVARALNIAHPTVANYVARGMPLSSVKAAAMWIASHIQLQAGKRGVGVRAASRVADVAPSAKPTNGNGRHDVTAESVRLLRLRGDKIQAELVRMEGGTDDERLRQLTETAALNVWWRCLQRDSHGGLTALLGRILEISDPVVLTEIDRQIEARDRRIAMRMHEVIGDVLSGRLPLVAGPVLHGVPWRE